jgi:hypothetical protein
LNNQNNLNPNEENRAKKPDIILKWSWPAHASVSEVVFTALPDNVQENLVLDAMKDGSNDPDEKFKDTASHHYPASYKKAVKWLDDGKNNYDAGNYNRASYCFGIASHYISDTFSAPHCVSKESGKDHHNFEIVNDDYTPTATLLADDLDTIMQKGIQQGKEDWEEWKETKDTTLPHKEADLGASAAYTAIKNILP